MSLEATLPVVAPAPLSPAAMIPAPERHALLLVGIHEQTWTPTGGMSMPSVQLKNVSVKFRAGFVRDFNSEPGTARSNEMALLLSRGGVYIWKNVHEAARPVDPMAFPVTAEGPLMTFNVAHKESIRRNDEIVKVARVPRVWWMVIHDVAAALQLMTGDTFNS